MDKSSTLAFGTYPLGASAADCADATLQRRVCKCSPSPHIYVLDERRFAGRMVVGQPARGIGNSAFQLRILVHSFWMAHKESAESPVATQMVQTLGVNMHMAALQPR